MIDNKDSKKRYRVDHLIEGYADELEAGGKKDRGRCIAWQKWTACWLKVISTD